MVVVVVVVLSVSVREICFFTRPMGGMGVEIVPPGVPGKQTIAVLNGQFRQRFPSKCAPVDVIILSHARDEFPRRLRRTETVGQCHEDVLLVSLSS
jgi:hypothetical protein